MTRARCLDLTRLVSRAGTGPATGIDRVERAYLDRLLSEDAPLYCLVRTAVGLSLLDRDGAQAVRRHLDGLPWGPGDLAARVSRRLSPVRRQAEATVRRLALATAPRLAQRLMLCRWLPPGTVYYNTGHSNLDARTFAALAAVPDRRVAVLIHDTIPLDHPEFQRPGTPARFSDRLATAARHADRLICISRHTEQGVRRHAGAALPCVVAPLGIDPPSPDPDALPPGLPTERPFFVALGTIEPRKNHAFLLDLWAALEAGPDETPALFIVGRRGWNNAEVFRRLDSDPMMGRSVFELSDLGDGAVAALLRDAAGLLHPSHAEGFGLPPAEAAALGTPVIAAPLEVTREVLGHLPVYADTADRYLWMSEIGRLFAARRKRQDGAPRPATALPTWQSHFETVFDAVEPARPVDGAG
ncbi:glycosyltransferase family 4 protein [Tranquillimonas rosea]|uniref:glycosyltransferase family 4 protein n=1 Tax=Tranquillimonas rosea TaxID=641238 RepID=UPI003BA9EE86